MSFFRVRVCGRQFRFLGGAVHLVLAQDPPSEPDHSQRCDQESGAQAEPRRNPLADQQDHIRNYRQIGG